MLSGHHHGPAIDAAGEQLAAFEPQLAVVQMPPLLPGELTVEQHGQPDRLVHLRTRWDEERTPRAKTS
jgi:hypothetical protein